MNLNKEWVDPKYTNELSVLFGFIAFILPWNIMTGFLQELQLRVFYLRFPLVEIAYLPASNSNPLQYAFVSRAYTVQIGNGVEIAYIVWLIASVLVTVAFIYSILLYIKEEKIESLTKYPPSKLMGTVILGSAFTFSASTVLLYMNGIPGIQIPLGTIILFIFGGVLLTNPVTQKEEAENN